MAAELSPQAVAILLTLLSDHHRGREVYVQQIVHASRVAARTVDPVLARLEQYGLTESRMEGDGARTLGRPWRRYWKLTPEGVEYATVLSRIDNLQCP